jgi:hypothetical protein
MTRSAWFAVVARPKEGVILLRVRALVTALLVGVPVALFLLLWMHAMREFGLLVAGLVGLSIYVVVASGTDDRDAAADAAWREAAPDLPPVSDRSRMEQSQASMPGPEDRRRTAARARDGRTESPGTPAGRDAVSK